MTALLSQPMGMGKSCACQISGKMLLWMELRSFPSISPGLWKEAPGFLSLIKSDMLRFMEEHRAGNHSETMGSPEPARTARRDTRMLCLEETVPFPFLSVLSQICRSCEALCLISSLVIKRNELEASSY